MKAAERADGPAAPASAPGNLSAADGYAMPYDAAKPDTRGARGGQDRAEESKRAREAAANYAVTGWVQSSRESYEEDAKEVYTTVRKVGTVILYRRGDVWMTPEAAKLDLEKDADKIKTIERYSDAYFALTKENTPSENQALSLQAENEKLLIVLRGQAYLIK